MRLDKRLGKGADAQMRQDDVVLPYCRLRLTFKDVTGKHKSNPTVHLSRCNPSRPCGYWRPQFIKHVTSPAIMNVTNSR